MHRLKLLLKWGKPYWIMLLTVLFLSGFLQYLYSYLSILVQYAFKVIEGNTRSVNLPFFILDNLNKIEDQMTAIIYIGIVMVALQFFRSIMRFTDTYLRGRLTENIRRNMRIKLYSHINNLSYSYHNSSDTGDLMQRCTSDIETSSGFISGRIPDIVSIIATVASGAWQVGLINFQLMLISLCAIPISLLASIIYFRYVNSTFIDIEKSEAKMTTIIQENLASARIVRAFANEKFENDKLDAQSIDYMNKSKKFSRMMATFWGSSDLIVMAQYVITILVGIYFVRDSIIDAGDMAACIMLIGMMIWPIRNLGRIISEFGKALVAAERIDKILIEPSEYDNDGNLLPEIKGNIEFKNVCFRFPNDDKHLLNDVSFKINAGEVIAFVGKTGSGKSTIANIMTRLLDIDCGQVLIDGIMISDINKKHLRKNIGMVMQDPFLFSKTVYDNIGIANRNADEEGIYEAAKAASIHKDILKFTNGYSTLVGERGTTLSGGQKQRVAIARILVDKRPVIIFDDSLSAVDTKTDLMIRTALKKKKDKVTMIIVTHRTSTAKEADKIIVLDKGVVENIGSHEDLILREGLYKRLWNIQGKLEMEFLEFIKGGASID